LIPDGEEVTVPPPSPDFVTLSGKVILVKLAVTERAWLMVTTQEPVPVHAPDHPAKVEVASGRADKVTCVPIVNEAEQIVGQVMPAGLDVTLPPPVPVLLTESAKAFFANAAFTERA
jgi:hypothetical protein